MSIRTSALAALALAAFLTLPAQAAKSPVPGAGLYRVSMRDDVQDLPHHTVYMPEDISAMRGAKMPIFVWGNGGCEDEGNRYRYFLSHIAAHGYLVVALGKIGPASRESAASGWPSDPVLPPTPPDVNAPAASYPAEMTQAIDWALAQNAEEGSPLQGRIETTKIGVSGHSCGGLQALTIATTDPRVTTTLMLGTGVWSLGPGGLPGAPDVTKQSLKSVNGTIAYINGALDIALPNAKEDFALLSHVPAMLAQRKDVAHSGTYWLPNGGAFGTVSLAWLDWQLKDDARAGGWFVGEDCRLCTDQRWTIERKNFP
jgi:dienelactone hydrolase